MAWLGLADMSKKKIKLASSAGIPKSLIDVLHNKTYDKMGPTEHLLKGNEYYVINDISKETEIWNNLPSLSLITFVLHWLIL